MDEQLQRRLIGVIVGVGVILLGLWMIPGRPPGDAGPAESATISVADAARAAQNQSLITPPSAAANGAANTSSAGTSSPAAASSTGIAPANSAAPSPVTAARGTPIPGAPATAAAPVTASAMPKTSIQAPTAASALSAAEGARPSAALAAALASAQPSQPTAVSVPPPARPATITPVNTAKLPAKSAATTPAATTPVIAPVSKPATIATASAPATSTTATRAAPAGKAWYVQIGSFSASDKAQLIANLIANAGFSAEMAPVRTSSGSTLYRVRSGPYASSAKADEALGKLRQQGYPDARRVAE